MGQVSAMSPPGLGQVTVSPSASKIAQGTNPKEKLLAAWRSCVRQGATAWRSCVRQGANLARLLASGCGSDCSSAALTASTSSGAVSLAHGPWALRPCGRTPRHHGSSSRVVRKETLTQVLPRKLDTKSHGKVCPGPLDLNIVLSFCNGNLNRIPSWGLNHFSMTSTSSKHNPQIIPT